MDEITIRRTVDQPVLAIRHAVPSSMFQATDIEMPIDAALVAVTS